jgi:alkylhydroperoxidase family enzyme
MRKEVIVSWTRWQFFDKRRLLLRSMAAGSSLTVAGGLREVLAQGHRKRKHRARRTVMNKPTRLSLPVSALVTITAALVAVIAIPARAEGPVARVPAVQENSTDPDVKAMFDNARNRGGQVINLSLIRGNAPKLARAASAVAYAIRFETKTPRPLVELAILRTAQLWEGDYEINQHRPMMRACGYTPQQIDAVGNWRASTLFSDRQRALLAYVDQAARGDVDDGTFAALEKFFDTQEIVEITITVDTYVGTALFTRALRIKIEDDGRQTAIGKC